MDQRKALFRTKLREAAQKQEKRIDSPLVRYNEYDQPVCRVCNVTLKSESLWAAHQVSRKHHDAVEKVRATAAGLTRGNNVNLEPPAEVSKPKSSAALPPDFFDSKGKKRQRDDMDVGGKTQHVSSSVGSGFSDHLPGTKELLSSSGESLKVQESVKENDLADVHFPETEEKGKNKPSSLVGQSSNQVDGAGVEQLKEPLPESFFDNKMRGEIQSSVQLDRAPRNSDDMEVMQMKVALPDGFFDNKEKSDSKHSNQPSQPSKRLDDSEVKQVKGALPEGFFDNKDADLRARGIEPVKVDINDAYKEFEKEIQDNLQEVDDRLEEEEIDAAEEREEFLSLEQKEYRERVDMVKKKLVEVKAARLTRGQQHPAFSKESSDESSSNDDDNDESFTVDWRAQHL